MIIKYLKVHDNLLETIGGMTNYLYGGIELDKARYAFVVEREEIKIGYVEYIGDEIPSTVTEISKEEFKTASDFYQELNRTETNLSHNVPRLEQLERENAQFKQAQSEQDALLMQLLLGGNA